MHHDRLNFMDCLPICLTPKPLEACSSYLARVAQANGVMTCNTWLRTLHINGYSRFDITLPNSDQLPRLLRVSHEQILATTFMTMKQKFRCEDLQFYKLLGGAVKPYMPYCPLCLAESGYYNLLWRLNCITGCAKHCCSLHDSCPQCGEHIVPLKTPLQVGHCSQCGFELSAAPIIKLTDEERDLVQTRTADMTYLVERDDIHLQYTVSEKLVRLRRLFGVSQLEIARDLCWRRDLIRKFEMNNNQTSILPKYINYADYLGLSLREVLAYREYDLRLPQEEINCIRRVCAIKRQDLIKNAQAFETVLLDNVKQAVHQLRTTGQPDSQIMIAKQVSVGPPEMILYPRVKSYLEQVEQERISARVQIWIEQIRAAILKLDSENQPPFATSISQIVGYHVQSLRHHPEIDALLTPAIARAQQYIQITEDGVQRYEQRSVVAERIRTLVLQAEEQGIYLFKKEIADLVGARFETLNNDPMISPLFEAHETWQVQTWYTRKRTAIEQAYCQLRESNKRVTTTAIIRLAGVSHYELAYYDSLQQRVQTLVMEYKMAHEIDLLRKVQTAVADLRSTNEPVSLQRIGQQIGMTPGNLKRYPSIYAYFNTLPELPTPLSPHR